MISPRAFFFIFLRLTLDMRLGRGGGVGELTFRSTTSRATANSRSLPNDFKGDSHCGWK